MGRNQHSKDRLFITATEWATEYGGKKRERAQSRRQLPFDCCALSLQPFENPICTKEGVIFDILRIMPFIKKHKCNPVNSEPLRFKDLIQLNMSKNAEGKWHCPVTFKVFNDNARIVAVRTSGYVYSMEAVQELNIKPKNWKDLMTDEPFTKQDLIMLQDPDNEGLKEARDISNFTYLKEMRDEKAAELASGGASSNMRVAPSTAALFKDIEVERQKKKQENALNMIKMRAEEELEMDSIPDLASLRKLRPTMEDLNPGAKQTDSKASQSFTSSGVEVNTQTSMRLATLEEIREARWRCCRKIGKKGYVQIQTSCGNINLEVQSDIVPMTSENFLKLCSSNAYVGTKFHRLIPGFMVQGGDTTKGDGTGGMSCWGEPFKDEFDSRLLHVGRGIVSMANSGKNTNRSQFFMCFRACRHLDNVHTIFAKIVGGNAVLDRIEKEPRDAKTDKPLGDLTIIGTEVFADPLNEATEMLENLIKERQDARLTATSKLSKATGGAAGEAPQREKLRLAASAASERKGWHSTPTPAQDSSSTSVGKYMGTGAVNGTIQALPSTSKRASTTMDSFANEPVETSKKQKAAGTKFSDFSSW